MRFWRGTGQSDRQTNRGANLSELLEADSLRSRRQSVFANRNGTPVSVATPEVIRFFPVCANRPRSRFGATESAVNTAGLFAGRSAVPSKASHKGAALYWTLSAFASYTVFPPTIVSTDSVFGNSGGGTLKISCDSTTRSANFPGSRLPLSFSANSA